MVKQDSTKIKPLCINTVQLGKQRKFTVVMHRLFKLQDKKLLCGSAKKVFLSQLYLAHWTDIQSLDFGTSSKLLQQEIPTGLLQRTHQVIQK